MVDIAIHPSIANLDLEKVLVDSLKANRLDPKLLYVTSRQAALWREVSKKHSPVNGNPEFARIYHEACEKTVEHVPPGKVHIVGLGPGRGVKEAQLAAGLRVAGRKVNFTAIDVSRDLTEESAGWVATMGGVESRRHLVCDLAELDYIQQWLDAGERDSRRVYTFFGMVPNLEPAFVAKLLNKLLRPGDLLLASVHLAPVDEHVDVATAMKLILPQYDNPETLAWLREAMEHWKLKQMMGTPWITRSEQMKIPCILGLASWKSLQAFSPSASAAGTPSEVAFQLFHSLRYTPKLFTHLLQVAGVRGEMLAMTACREEAIWSVRNDLDSRA